jgi:hypothetical protein
MIDLTDVPFQSAEPRMPENGVTQKPVRRGVITRINWIGSGFSGTLVLPPMLMEPDGRRLVVRLQQAKPAGAIIAYPQPDFNVGSPGSPTVDGAHAGGTTLSITGATANYAVAQGQALNVTKGGRTYLYFAAAQAILDSDGAGDVVLTTPLRTQLVGGEAVGLAQPVMECWIISELAWPINMDRTTGLTISVDERA